MSANHDIENEGSKPRDHVHARHHFLKQAHQDWRVWIAVALMLAMILVYVLTNNLSLQHGKPAAVEPTPTR